MHYYPASSDLSSSRSRERAWSEGSPKRNENTNWCWSRVRSFTTLTASRKSSVVHYVRSSRIAKWSRESCSESQGSLHTRHLTPFYTCIYIQNILIQNILQFLIVWIFAGATLDKSLPRPWITLNAQNHPGNDLNRQGNDPWPRTIKQNSVKGRKQEKIVFLAVWHSRMIFLRLVAKRKLGSYLICQRDKKMLQPPSKLLVF
jgi:hypothetical protein